MAEQVTSINITREGSNTFAASARDIFNYTTINNSRTTPELPGIYFNVRGPEVNFVGRSKELERLDNSMQSSSSKRMIVVSGLGGIGKTQLIRKFIDKNRESYKNVVWIHSENAATIKDSFKRLAIAKFSIPTTDANGKEKDFISIVEDVFNRLSEQKTLIVYDNVDEIGDIKFMLTMQASGTKFDVLITSRIQKWGNQIDMVPLKVWEIDDAIEYISTTLDDPDSTYQETYDDKKLLVEKLQCFPLALKQATAYINYQREVEIFRIVDYIQKYDTNDTSDTMEILDSTFFQDDPFNIYEKTTFTTWRVTIDAIEQDGVIGQLAIRILQIIAFFYPDDIPRDIFVHLPFDAEDQQLSKKIKIDYKRNVIGAVRLLVNYSMLDSQRQQSVLSVHRLVQKVIKLELESARDGEKPILRDCLLLIPKLIENIKLHESHLHAVSVFLCTLKFNELVIEFRGIPNDIATTLIASGKYNRAEEFAKEILESLMKILGEDHRDTLTCKHNIARSLTQLGKHTEAHKMYQEVLEKANIGLGEDDPLTLTCKHRIAGSHIHMGKYSEALEIYQDVVEKRKTVLGEGHPDTLRSKHQIALSLGYLGKHTEAFQIYEEVFEKRKNILGEDHPDTLTSKHQIAYSLGRLGKHTEALQIYKEIFEKEKIVLGEDHPETLTSKSQIAHSLRHLDKYTEALQIYREVLEKDKSVLGTDHPNTLTSKYGIAHSLAGLGEHKEALQIFEEVFEKRKIVLGVDHPDTLTSKHEIALLLSHLFMDVETPRVPVERVHTST